MTEAKKLLIADDDPSYVTGLTHYGRSRGFDVLSCERGDEAVRLAIAEKPDVILLDVNMPGLGGREVIERLTNLGITRDSVVVFVSGCNTPADRVAGLELGAHDYESKPVDFGRLFDKIAHLLDKMAAGEV